jgi:hypothetical protein
LPLEQRFPSSNQAEDDGILKGKKFVARLSWRESKTVIRFYGMLKIPEEHGTDISPAKLTDISRQVSPRFATRCVYCSQSIEFWWMNRE